MELPKRILVAYDFTETSMRALDYALILARPFEASVTALHVFEIPVLGYPEAGFVATADFVPRMVASAEKALDSLGETYRTRGTPIETVLRSGEPWREIDAFADELDASVIVLGTHGRRGLARALLGSVAEKVIRTQPRPVLAIRGPN